MTAIADRLDASGLNCPHSILRTRKAIKRLASVQVPEVTATGPGSLKDRASFCAHTGNRLMSSNETDIRFVYLIEKA